MTDMIQDLIDFFNNNVSDDEIEQVDAVVSAINDLDDNHESITPLDAYINLFKFLHFLNKPIIKLIIRITSKFGAPTHHEIKSLVTGIILCIYDAIRALEHTIIELMTTKFKSLNEQAELNNLMQQLAKDRYDNDLLNSLFNPRKDNIH